MTYDRSVSTGRLIPVNPMPNLYAVDAIGTSVFAVALNRIPEAVAFRFDEGLSEDLFFCRQVSNYNQMILVDGRVRTSHMGRPKALRYEP